MGDTKVSGLVRPLPPEVVEEGVLARVISTKKGDLDSVGDEFTVVILKLEDDVVVANVRNPIAGIIGLRAGQSIEVGNLVFTVREIIKSIC